LAILAGADLFDKIGMPDKTSGNPVQAWTTALTKLLPKTSQSMLPTRFFVVLPPRFFMYSFLLFVPLPDKDQQDEEIISSENLQLDTEPLIDALISQKKFVFRCFFVLPFLLVLVLAAEYDLSFPFCSVHTVMISRRFNNKKN
jgi:hypothetical protein